MLTYMGTHPHASIDLGEQCERNVQLAVPDIATDRPVSDPFVQMVSEAQSDLGVAVGWTHGSWL